VNFHYEKQLHSKLTFKFVSTAGNLKVTPLDENSIIFWKGATASTKLCSSSWKTL